jgi:hypothetical protein
MKMADPDARIFQCLTFIALSRVKELNNLIFIETVDYSKVKKLGGKQLQLRRQDRARRYHE